MHATIYSIFYFFWIVAEHIIYGYVWTIIGKNLLEKPISKNKKIKKKMMMSSLFAPPA